MNNMENIERLLEKYWYGETTLEEEKALKRYFASIQNAGHYDGVKAMFDFYEKERNISFDGHLSLPRTRIIRMPSFHKVAIAASIVLLAGFLWILSHRSNTATTTTGMAKYEVKDPQKAEEITNYALAMLGNNYKKGEKILMENMEKTQKINIVNSFINN